MSILRYIQKIEFLHQLIEKKATGNRDEFASKARMSKSMLSEYIMEMKELGFPIRYNRRKRCYYYEHKGMMVKSLFVHEKEDDV